MAQLHGGRRDQLEISPNLWAGVGLVRGGAGTALVGDPQTVAARIKEYQDVGIDTFIMSGYPHLEEAYRFAELVFPLLSLQQRRQRDAAARQYRPVRRDHRQRAPAAGQGIAIMSLIESLPRVRRLADAARRWPDPVDRAAGHHAGLADRLRHWLRAGAGDAGAERRGIGRMEAAAVGRTGAQHLGQLLARRHRLRDRRRHRLCLRACQRPVAAQQQADRHHAADGAQHPASGADPAGHPVVRHR